MLSNQEVPYLVFTFNRSIFLLVFPKALNATQTGGNIVVGYDGIYNLINKKSKDAPNKPVYKLKAKPSDRYIFYRPGSDGWVIGDEYQLTNFRYKAFYSMYPLLWFCNLLQPFTYLSFMYSKYSIKRASQLA